MTDKEKIIAYIDKLLEKYPKNYYLLTVAEFIDSLQEEPVSEDFDALDQLLAKYAIDFSYKGKTLKECSGRYKAEIIAIANHLEPVSEDLEKAAKKEMEIVNAFGGEFPPNPLDMELIKTIFIHGAEWQKERIIIKVCKWFNNNACNYFGHMPTYPFIDDLKQAMKDE